MQFPAKLKFCLEVFIDHVCECGGEILQRPVLQTTTTTKLNASKTKRSWGGKVLSRLADFQRARNKLNDGEIPFPT